jgi:hypothetical protein
MDRWTLTRPQPVPIRPGEESVSFDIGRAQAIVVRTKKAEARQLQRAAWNLPRDQQSQMSVQRGWNRILRGRSVPTR